MRRKLTEHTEAETVHLVYVESHGIIYVLLRESRIVAKMFSERVECAASQHIDYVGFIAGLRRPAFDAVFSRRRFTKALKSGRTQRCRGSP